MSPTSESGATRVWPALKDTIVDQFTAGKDMDEAAMEGVAGGGGGHGLASGTVRASDLDILRDNPGAAASRSTQVDAGPSLARRRRPGRFAGHCGCPPRRAQNTRTVGQPRATRRAPTLARHHAPPTDGNRLTASGERCAGDQAARSEARSACHASRGSRHGHGGPASVHSDI